MNDKIIFVIGHPRSGTTLLNKVLLAHPKINFITFEFNDLSYFYFNQHLYEKYGKEKYLMMTKDFFKHPWIQLSLIQQPVESIKTSNINTNNFQQFVHSFLNEFRLPKDNNLIGIKISDNITNNVSMIAQIFKDAHCVHIIRDPRDIFLSTKKNFGTVSPFYGGKSWAENVSQIMSLKNELKHYYELRYEQFVTNSKEELEKLCSFLGVDFDNQMLEFYKKIINPSKSHSLLTKKIVTNNFNKWQTNLSDKKLELLYAGAGAKIFQLGYSDKEHNSRISFLERLKEFILEKSRLSVPLVLVRQSLPR
ncbi:MAG: hypothetical protein CMI53_01415 [Parcubacteria group bacterium]|nr:hypothetical protein [Parcubacteria group bacterium]|tara:strand:- start:416 stop:1336 length:921 start_codon:yes stop_codon:yes gene_type:complete